MDTNFKNGALDLIQEYDPYVYENPYILFLRAVKKTDLKMDLQDDTELEKHIESTLEKLLFILGRSIAQDTDRQYLLSIEKVFREMDIYFGVPNRLSASIKITKDW